MMADVAAKRRRWGSVLVALQFGLIAALAWLALPRFLAAGVPVGAWALVALGAVLGVWALQANRPGNFNIRPTPRDGGHLVQRGPYRWIRHPMYTSVAACALGCAWTAASPWSWAAAAALCPVLLAKALLEERWMTVAHPRYDAYRARTWRFIPWLV